MSYVKILKKAQCESIETTIRKRRLFFAGAVQRTSNEGLTHRVDVRDDGWWGEPGTRPTRKELAPVSGRHQGIRSNRGVHGYLPFTVRSRDCYGRGRWIVDAADRFMTRWHRGDAEKSWQRLTAEDAKSSNQGKPGGRGGGEAAVLIQL